MLSRTALCGLFAFLPALALAQSCIPFCSTLLQSPQDKVPPEGYLCCNMRTDGSWISDSNYMEPGQYVLPLGTPVRPTSFGRFRLNADIGGRSQSIGNDYSRNISMDEFAKRYVLAVDPKTKMSGYSDKMRAAISSAKLLPGMTREQVLMSIGYPIGSENPNFNANVWRYWLTPYSEFQIKFDDTGKVSDITGDPLVKGQVIYN